jgi:ABC-type branched-subunit amino acid transport system substrate-binding protein
MIKISTQTGLEALAGASDRIRLMPRVLIQRKFHSLLLAISLSLFLAACNFPGSTQPVIKIGLVAPFEGRYRSIGYEAIYAARLAIREINSQGGINGHRIELVALDDRGEPDQAIMAARKLTIDPQVMAVIGHYRPASTDAAIEAYCAQQVPVIAMESVYPLPEKCLQPISVFVLGHASIERWLSKPLVFVSAVSDPNGLPAAQSFISTYNAIPIDGTRAGPIALQTYDALGLVFDAIRRSEMIDRGNISAALNRSVFNGLGGQYTFDSRGNLIGTKVYVFQYGPDGKPKLIP